MSLQKKSYILHIFPYFVNVVIVVLIKNLSQFMDSSRCRMLKVMLVTLLEAFEVMGLPLVNICLYTPLRTFNLLTWIFALHFQIQQMER